VSDRDTGTLAPGGPLGEDTMTAGFDQVVFDRLFEAKRWDDMVTYLTTALEEDPENHWLLSRMSMAHYERRDYDQALYWAEQAFVANQACPLVLWDFAGALDMLGQGRKAIAIWKELLARGVDRIANDECGEGSEWALALLADCEFRIAASHCKLGDTEQAREHLEIHRRHRESGAQSIYSDGDLEELANDIRTQGS